MKGATIIGCTAIVFATATAASDVQPLITLSGHLCQTARALTAAQPLAYSGREKSYDVEIDAGAACATSGQGPVLYRVFQLPAAAEPYVVTVSSEPFGGAILLPHLLLLDSAGTVRREFARDDLLFRGTALSARFRSHPDEVYLVVESDPGLVGSSISRIGENTSSYVMPAGAGYFMIHTGSDSTTQLTYSHTGKLEIVLEPLPKAG